MQGTELEQEGFSAWRDYTSPNKSTIDSPDP